MTSDDVIAMHKATQRVIEDVSYMEFEDDRVVTDNRLERLAEHITALATVQRDLLAAMLNG